MPSFSAKRAAERPDEIALRDGRNAFTWAQGRRSAEPRRQRALRSGSRPRPPHRGVRRRTAPKRCSRTSAGWSLALDRAGELPPHRRRGRLHPRGLEGAVVFVGPENARRGRRGGAHRPGSRSGRVAVRGHAGRRDGTMVPRPPRATGAVPRGPSRRARTCSTRRGRPGGRRAPSSRRRCSPAGATIARARREASRSHRSRRLRHPHLIVGPMYHTGPLSGSRLARGGHPRWSILGRFDAEAVLRSIDELQVRVDRDGADALRAAARSCPRRRRRSTTCRAASSSTHTGAKCPVDVKRRMIEWWGPIFIDAYGATEVGTTCTITSVDWLALPGLGRQAGAAVRGVDRGRRREGAAGEYRGAALLQGHDGARNRLPERP